MAHTKAIGAGKYGKDSRAKYRGVKLFDGQPAVAGNIIVRQTGSKVHAGPGVRTGSDYTLYAAVNGLVKYSTRRKTNFDGKRSVVKTVSIQQAE